MTIRYFLKPSLLKIIVALIIPLTIWYGPLYGFSGEYIGKPDNVDDSWGFHLTPQVINIPYTIVGWSVSGQQIVIDENFILNDTITIAISLLINYLIACSLIFFRSQK